MADVLPFRGLRYAPDVVGSLSDVLCPPFDVISSQLQDKLHDLSDYNAVRLELGRPAESSLDVYASAANLFASWKNSGALVREKTPSFYLLRHRFPDAEGFLRERWALTGAVRLQEFNRRIVLPHEETLGAPKKDRMALMEACNSNFSPVMALYRKGSVAEIASNVAKNSLGVEIPYLKGEDLEQWVVTDPEFISLVRDGLKDIPLFIADGHHRYETALLYRDRLRERSSGWAENEAYNFVMMTLIDFDDPGLVVGSYHRTLGGLTTSALSNLRERLMDVFHAEPFLEASANPDTLVRAVIERNKHTPTLGLLGMDGKSPYLLSLPSRVDHKSVTTHGALASYEGSVLQEAVLNPVLGSSTEHHTSFTHDSYEAWKSVIEGQKQLAFFQRPFPLDLFEAVVSEGALLPPKSTYFYPKFPTGLVFNSLEGTIF